MTASLVAATAASASVESVRPKPCPITTRRPAAAAQSIICRRPQEPALLHDLHLHDVGRLSTDDVDQRGRSRHALVGHERDADRPADLGETGDVGSWKRLLDERQRVGLEPSDERHRLGQREALVEIDAQRQTVADRGPDRGDARDALVAGAR